MSETETKEIRRTALYATHQQLGARTIEFGGWMMPVQYSGIIEEHRAVRTAAGLFDLSHMGEFEVSGPGALDFLQYVTTNDVGKLEIGQAQYNLLCYPDGGIVDDLLVYRLPDKYYLVVNASNIEKDFDWMSQTLTLEKFEADFRNVSYSTSLISLQGPRAVEILQPLVATVLNDIPYYQAIQGYLGETSVIISRTGYTGEDGFELFFDYTYSTELWNLLMDAGKDKGLLPIGLGARDTLRLEAGMNLYGQDMDDETTPLESNLAWTIDMSTDRKFMGRAALETAPTRQLVGLVPLGAGILRGHQAVQTTKGNGEITSGSFSPTLNMSIAFTRVPAGVAIGDTVQAEVRGKWLDCRVTKFPFVRNGQSLI